MNAIASHILASLQAKYLFICLKPHLHEATFCVRFFDKNGSGKVAFIQRRFGHDNWDRTDGNNCLTLFSYQYCYNWKLYRRIVGAITNRSETSSDFALKRFRISLSEWKQLETVIFSNKVTFITMRTIIGYRNFATFIFIKKSLEKKSPV